MTKSKAHELLNAAKAGLPMSKDAITMALYATGDLQQPARTTQHAPGDVHVVPAFSTDAPVDEEQVVIVHTPVGQWERKTRGLAPAQWFEVVA